MYLLCKTDKISIPLQAMLNFLAYSTLRNGYCIPELMVTGYKSAPGAVTTFLKTKQLSTVAFKPSNHMVSTPPHTQTQGVESTCPSWRLKRQWRDSNSQATPRLYCAAIKSQSGLGTRLHEYVSGETFSFAHWLGRTCPFAPCVS